MQNSKISPLSYNSKFNPLTRSFIGFENIFQMLEKAQESTQNNSFPPYNIEMIDDDNFLITLALAGYKESEIEIEVERNTLTVKGKQEAEEKERIFIHKGISGRSFERKYQLGEFIEVLDADMQHGLLEIKLQRIIPEDKKPRIIEIGKS